MTTVNLALRTPAGDPYRASDAELEARYDELSWLEHADPYRATDPVLFAAGQDDVEEIFFALNQLVADGESRDPATGTYSATYRGYFADALVVLEAIAELIPHGPRR